MRSSYRYIYTSWARWGAEIAVVRLCPAQLYVVGCNFLTRCFPCTNQQMESLPLWFFPFVREIWRIQSSEKNTKGTISWLKKNETAVAVFPVCVHVRFKHEFKVSDRNSQILSGASQCCHLLSSLLVHAGLFFRCIFADCLNTILFFLKTFWAGAILFLVYIF